MDRTFVYRYIFGRDQTLHTRLMNQVMDATLDAAATNTALERALGTIRDLQGQLREQQEDSAQLGVFVGVLVKMLREQGVLDETALRHRVDAELEAIDEETRTADAATKAAAKAKRDSLPHEVCIRCQRRVLKTATTLTADGAVCDDCTQLAL